MSAEFRWHRRRSAGRSRLQSPHQALSGAVPGRTWARKRVFEFLILRSRSSTTLRPATWPCSRATAPPSASRPGANCSPPRAPRAAGSAACRWSGARREADPRDALPGVLRRHRAARHQWPRAHGRARRAGGMRRRRRAPRRPGVRRRRRRDRHPAGGGARRRAPRAREGQRREPVARGAAARREAGRRAPAARNPAGG